jgi:hypothetical protein
LTKDGHQFHEAWLERRALGLIFSRDGLCGITVEGLSKDIEEGAPSAAVEIADATFFYGERATFRYTGRSGRSEQSESDLIVARTKIARRGIPD